MSVARMRRGLLAIGAGDDAAGSSLAPSRVHDGIGRRHDGTHFDRSGARRGNALGEADGFIEILGVDEVVAAEVLAGFGERAVGRLALAVANANRGGRGGRLERVAALVVAALGDGLRERAVLGRSSRPRRSR